MGRPATKPLDLRDGFYVEIRNRGSRTGIKIRRDNQKQMEFAIKEYEKNKDVIVLGEYKNGKAVNKTK
jgi:hypothetical protein